MKPQIECNKKNTPSNVRDGVEHICHLFILHFWFASILWTLHFHFHFYFILFHFSWFSDTMQLLYTLHTLTNRIWLGIIWYIHLTCRVFSIVCVCVCMWIKHTHLHICTTICYMLYASFIWLYVYLRSNTKIKYPCKIV